MMCFAYMFTSFDLHKHPMNYPILNECTKTQWESSAHSHRAWSGQHGVQLKSVTTKTQSGGDPLGRKLFDIFKTGRAVKVMQQNTGPKYGLKHDLTTTWLNVLTCQACVDQEWGVVSHKAWPSEVNVNISAHLMLNHKRPWSTQQDSLMVETDPVGSLSLPASTKYASINQN